MVQENGVCAVSALYIDDPEAHRLASALAAASGKSIPAVVIDALRAQTQLERRVARPIDYGRVEAILDRVSRKLPHQIASVDELIGYDERGLPR